MGSEEEEVYENDEVEDFMCNEDEEKDEMDEICQS